MSTKFKLENGVEFSPSERCLIGPDGTVLELTENSLRFLILLLNGVTEKEKLIHQVWKEQSGAISESSYYGQLYTLRKAFSQVGLKETLIRTIPRKGAQYVGKVTKVVMENPSSVTEEVSVSTSSPQQTTVDSVQPRVVDQNWCDKEKAETVNVAPRGILAESRLNKFASLLAVVAVCWLSILSVLTVYILLNHITN
ncbi:membrane protein [Pragia fontium]|uniref:Membrane protein n=1 Tax=Pragia fontium TaxID=82985 RepID=A0ABQ5LI73_9GAMM|nr:hypothetical protein [Pragia fontium]GKX63301.1 membrane protein [Pragia fontium]